jgi:hypothetical protein
MMDVDQYISILGLLILGVLFVESSRAAQAAERREVGTL